MRAGFAVATLAAMLASTAPAQVPDARWLPAWGAAQMRVEGADADRLAAAGPVTIRQIVRLTADGDALRVRLSNVAGEKPLVVGRASIARGRAGAAAVTAPRALTFGGAPGVTIAAGAEVYSDPVEELPVAAGDDLAVSLFLPAPATRPTGHPGARATTFLLPGEATLVATPAAPARIGGWWGLSDVEVRGGARTGTVVAIGDSITDGRGVRDDANARWPDLLARRLAADPRTRALSVVNAGLGGNRVLADGSGPSLLARFDRDVIARPGVRHVIVLAGVNDLGTLTRDAPVPRAAHADAVAALTGAYRQLVARAHAHGIRVIGGTITPFAGNAYYHPDAATEADRQAVNAFIRYGNAFDGVADFDAAVRDPAAPDRLLAAYDSGDHLHPSEAGYRATAAAIPTALFGRADAAARRPRIALTFDDLPRHAALPPGGTRTGVLRAILDALAAYRATAFGFVNGIGLGDADERAALAAWRERRLPLGNHTWGHVNLDQVGAAAFLADVDRNAASLPRAAERRWFRYPFLAEGSDAAARDAVRAGLRTRGYRVAAVTMSFGDYAWNDAYARCAARGDAVRIAALEASFLAAAETQAIRARALSHAVLGRDIPYVLLMHGGAFDARMLPRLLDLYASLGFDFTTLAAAEADPFYAAATDLALPGPSPTLEAAAAAKGVAVPANAPLPDAATCG